MGFLIRWLFAFVLLVVTYNPTRWNYVEWTMANWESKLSISVFLGLLIIIGYIIYLRATVRSIGLFGMFLVLSVFGTLVWVLYDQGWVNLTNPTVNTWAGIFALSVVLAIGLSWSIVRRRLSGQADVDDIDE
jgi:hypothetical protein